jgi:hypothetical protein
MYIVSFAVLALPSDDGQYWSKQAEILLGIKFLRFMELDTLNLLQICDGSECHQ